MRITANYFAVSLTSQLNRLASDQYRLQNQAATGKRVHAPEDDPGAVRRTLELSAESATLKQFQSNIATLRERATASLDALKAVKTISDRAGEIATLADGTKSPEELRIYATEVTQLIQQAAQILNSKHRGQALFGGTITDQQPFVVSTDSSGRVTGVAYRGNANVAEAEVDAGIALTVDAPGANNTGSGPRGIVSDTRTGADFFQHLISLQNHLLEGDTRAIATTDRPALRVDEDNLLYHIAHNGAVQSRLEVAGQAADTRALSVEQMISRESDADLADTLVKFNKAQYAYQAALQSSAAILNRSLLDYL